MNEARVRGSLLAWPGRIETPGVVKRRLLLVASIMAIALSGFYVVDSMGAESPWSSGEVIDMCGLPYPPVTCAQGEDGSLHQLSPAELAQLQEIRNLVERFPVPEAFSDVRPPRSRGGGG
jgi:hypothetical protein